MKRAFAALALLAAWLGPGVASAHPLGNFTVNHYARLEPMADRVRVVYVVDMAEIPTFQDRPQSAADTDAYAAARAESIRQNLHLSVDGHAVPLSLEGRSLSFPEGAGGLATSRLELTFLAPVAASGSTVDIAFRDDSDPTRIGWREIVARAATSGVEIQHASVPADDLTNELRHYPEELLNSPPNVREAQLTVSVAGGAASEPRSAAAPVITSTGSGFLERTRRAFAELANGSELTPAFIIFAVGVAIVLGATHALQPGHGKTIVAAYLVGSRGTARHAMFLGATVTATHTAGVYALGLVTLFLSQYVLPERLYPILEAVSGLLVVAIGVWLFGQRLLLALGHAHDHAHDHEHDHAPGHTHPSERASWRSLLALGVSGGLLPCPEALMVLLITIAAHRVLFGLLLIVSFSTGLAAVLVGFGLLLVYARGLFARLNVTGGLVPRLLPVASALVIVVAGSVITSQALPQVL
jgi:nickel/cobalt transporter (NicO) family protein